MRALLDVNVLLALLDEQHVHHHAASDWFDDNVEQGWATCPITQNGCIRILSQPRYSNPRSIAEAIERLRAVTSSEYHEFVADDISLLYEGVVDVSRLSNHRDLTDVYLLSLAVRHGCRFVTMDRGVQIAAVSGASEGHLVVI